MLIARATRKKNIAEYVLYMWQVEDMLRAFRFDMAQIDGHVVRSFQVDEATLREMHEWYDNLIAMMRQEGVEQKGHIQALKNIVNELTELHFFLLHQKRDLQYQQIVTMAAGNMIEFREKSGAQEDISDVELALNALYGHLMLRLQKKEISQETEKAMETFSKMLGYLAARYKLMEEEEEYMYK